MEKPKIGEVIESVINLKNTILLRDAIHVPVFLARAKAPVPQAGEHVKMLVGSAQIVLGCPAEEAIGIVDPFITKPIVEGDGFYVFVKPGSINNLSHNWTHPQIKEPTDASAAQAKKLAETWLKEFAAKRGIEYTPLIIKVMNQEELIDNDLEIYNLSQDETKMFWVCMELVLGKSYTSKYNPVVEQVYDTQDACAGCNN